jgi:MFS family permease
MAQVEDDSRSLRTFTPALVLLAICSLISYVDRGNLSIAAPLLKDELGISASQLGILLAGFFWSYTAMQFVSGWLLDRFEVNWLLAVGYLLWSLATVTTGLVHGFIILLAMRLLLGIGESVAYPSCSKLLALHLPEHHRGFANGLIQSALGCGNAVGTFGAGLLMATYGWRPVFIGMGLLSLLWLPAWMRWKPCGTVMGHSIGKTATAVDVMRQRSFWGASMGHFCIVYLLYFMVTWLPFYLVRERHLSMQSMASTASAFYLADALSAVASGRLSDFWIRKGYTPTLVRKTVMVIGCAAAAIAMAACAAGPRLYLPWLMTAGIGSGMARAGIFAFAQTLAGPQVAGRWTGLQNGFGNLAGIVAPALTGFVVDRTGSFAAPLGITAAVLVVGGLVWVFVVGRVEEVRWSAEGELLIAATTGPL